MDEHIDIDSRINWVDFYSKHIKNPRSCGKDKMHACCPFHQEKHPSFWFNTKNGCFKCEGCGESGNATVFLSKVKGIDQKDAYKELLELAGIDTTEQKKPKEKPKLPEYGIEIYGAEKCISPEWLKDECFITNGTDQSGKHIKIPYKNEQGTVQAVRKRYHPENPNGKFKWQKDSTLCLYGLWKIAEYKEYAILVEGESDTQSMWTMGFNTLGVPGATNFKEAWVEKLRGIPKIYIHQEPDKGGATFRQKCIENLYSGKYDGEVYVIKLGDYKVKDPSELYIKYGVDEAAEDIKQAIKKAEKVDLEAEGENLPDIIPGIPIKLKEPDGWKMSDDGIFKYDTRTEQHKRICRTPIIIVKRLRNLETDEEKIQIAFKKNNRWRFGIFNSTTIYQSKNIVSLADLGALITSENAKQVVSFLEALESDNIDRIKEARAVSQLGWATEENFLPGHGGDIVLDVEPSMQYSVQSMLQPKGTLEEWCNMMREHRKHNKFRFFLSSAFVPPLLGKFIQGKNVIISIWGNSGTGKTAALKAALSVWGSPEKLMMSFNTTQVGLEQTAALFNNIPIGLDERQLAGDKQSFIEKLVYMIGEGTGKRRGTKNGGIAKTSRWLTWVLSTGEEPIAQSSTKDGVCNRLIEMYGRMFEDEKSASNMHKQTAKCYGVAWVKFIDELMGKDEGYIENIYERVLSDMESVAKEQGYTYADTLSIATTADILVSKLVFNEPMNKAYDDGIAMGKEILLSLPTKSERSVNKAAIEYIIEWIISNNKKFTDEYADPRYGFIERGKYYIVKFQLEEALKKMGYSYKKTIKYLAEEGIVPEKDGGTVNKYFDTKRGRMVEFDYNRAIAIQEASNTNRDDKLKQMGFTEVDEDDDLPF